MEELGEVDFWVAILMFAYIDFIALLDCGVQLMG